MSNLAQNLDPIFFLIPPFLPLIIALLFPSPLPSPLGEIRQRRLAFRIEETDGNVDSDRRNVLGSRIERFYFQDRFV